MEKTALRSFNGEQQGSIRAAFTSIVNALANYLESAYRDKRLIRRLHALEQQAAFDNYVQELEAAHRDGSELTAAEAIELYALSDAVIQSVINANDIGFACAASRSSKGYNLTKRLYGLKYSGLDPEDFRESRRAYKEQNRPSGAAE